MTDRSTSSVSARLLSLLVIVWLASKPLPTVAQEPGGTGYRVTGAGAWFPAEPDVLGNVVDGFLTAANSVIPEPPVALVAPHAGYQFSGAVAGAAYATLLGHSYKRVIVLGLSHGTPLRGATVLGVDFYETPLGRIPVDGPARDRLLASPLVHEVPAAHQDEHSLENQLPMLQRALGDFEIVGLLVGQLTHEERSELADVLREFLDEETLLVASSDFTHHGSIYGYTVFEDSVQQRLKTLNDLAMQDIQRVDPRGWDKFLEDTKATICGRNPVGLLLAVLEPDSDIRAARLAYDTSGRQTGDWSTSVSYAGIVFWKPDPQLTTGEQRTLLRLARNTLITYFDSAAAQDDQEYESTPQLLAPGAAFVSLKSAGELRGCIGHMAAVEPLYMSVARNTFWASQDPRFQLDPVSLADLPDLSIEISILTPLRRLESPETVHVGTDGLLIVRGDNHGVLLPHVPVEEGWDGEQFLAAACLKAGLPLDAWLDPETDVYRFSAHTFGEKEGSDARH